MSENEMLAWHEKQKEIIENFQHHYYFQLEFEKSPHRDEYFNISQAMATSGTQYEHISTQHASYNTQSTQHKTHNMRQKIYINLNTQHNMQHNT